MVMEKIPRLRLDAIGIPLPPPPPWLLKCLAPQSVACSEGSSPPAYCQLPLVTEPVLLEQGLWSGGRPSVGQRLGSAVLGGHWAAQTPLPRQDRHQTKLHLC